jgi:hypothetical protein
MSVWTGLLARHKQNNDWMNVAAVLFNLSRVSEANDDVEEADKLLTQCAEIEETKANKNQKNEKTKD